jgi:hypothetical protein
MTPEQNNIKWIILYSTILLVLLGGGIYYFSNLICRNRVEKAIASGIVDRIRLDSLLMVEGEKRELLLDSIDYKSKELSILQDRHLKLLDSYNKKVKELNTPRPLTKVTDGLQLFILEYNKQNNEG